MNFLGLGAVGEAVGECIASKYFLAGMGAVGAIYILSKLIRHSRPLMVEVTKEAISFKDWFSSSVAEGEEFWQDVAAEAKHLYKLDVEKKLAILQKQQEVLQRIKAAI